MPTAVWGDVVWLGFREISLREIAEEVLAFIIVRSKGSRECKLCYGIPFLGVGDAEDEGSGGR